jgi:hypothetical protein
MRVTRGRCVVLLQRGEVFYILEVVRGRFPFDTLKRKVMEVKRRYASGTQREQTLSGYPTIVSTPILSGLHHRYARI